MSSTLLASIATSVAAPMVRGLLQEKLGPSNARLAEAVVDAVADRAGVEPMMLDKFAADKPEVIRQAVLDVEAEMPQMIALYHASMDQQFALLQAEMKQPVWTWAWRPLWMYFLIVVWGWNIIGLHLLNALLKWQLPPVDWTTLLAITSLFMGLYMGGHTVKAFAAGVKGKKL